MELNGKHLYVARAKRSIDQSIFLIKALISRGFTEEELTEEIDTIKKSISDNSELLGEDFCIEQGFDLEVFLKDYRGLEEE